MTISDTTQHDTHDRHSHDSAQGDHTGHGGHDKHAEHDPEMFRRLFWWNLVLSVPVLNIRPHPILNGSTRAPDRQPSKLR